MKAGGRYWVLWVTGFICKDEAEMDDDIGIKGRRFIQMRPSYETDTFSFASVHSYEVTELEDGEALFDSKTELVGKGMCSYIRMDTDARKTRDDEFVTPHRGQKWLFELMDHCVDYDKVMPRRSLDQPEPCKRPRLR
jgi:hypothetical protein